MIINETWIFERTQNPRRTVVTAYQTVTSSSISPQECKWPVCDQNRPFLLLDPPAAWAEIRSHASGNRQHLGLSCHSTLWLKLSAMRR